MVGVPEGRTPRRRAGTRSPWWRLLPMLRPYRGPIVVAVVLVLGQVAAGTLAPILLREIIDEALPRRESGRLVDLCSGLFACTVFGLLAVIVQSILLNDVGQGVVHDLRLRVYDGVRRMPLTFFASRSVGEVQARLVSDVGGISSWLTGSAQAALGAAIQVVAALAVLVVFSWVLGVVSIALALVGAVLNDRIGRRRRALAEQSQRRTTELMTTVGEDLSFPGVVLGRTSRRLDVQSSRFARLSGEIASLNRRQRLEGRWTRLAVGTAFGGFTPVLLVVAGTLTTQLTVGTVVVLATMQARLTAPIQQLISLGSAAQVTSAMLQRTFDHVDLVGDVDPARAATPDDRPEVPPSIAAIAVGFTYPDQPRPAVDDVGLQLAPTGLTLVAGETGSGKSTLGMLLAGLLRPQAGSVAVDGRAAEPEELWQHVSFVPQETVLFRSSLRENLLFGAPDATDEELRSVVDRVGLTALVDGLAHGLDTDAGDHGRRFSGGERQRIGLARALLDDAPLLVVDEATSAVDAATAARLHDVLADEATRRAVVMISHRLPELPDDATVVVLAHGELVEHGSHATLVDQGGRYAELVAAQRADGAGRALDDAPAASG